MITNKLITNIIFFFVCLFFFFSSRSIYLSKNRETKLCFFFFVLVIFFLCLLLRFVCQTEKQSLFHIVDTIKKIKSTDRIEYMCVWIFRSFCYPFILDFLLAFLRFTTLLVVLLHTQTYILKKFLFLVISFV